MAGGPRPSLAAEVQSQPAALERFAEMEFPRASKGSVFVGAGDSYAAALAGFFSSGGKCLALDPYTLASKPEISKGQDVYFISVSGRTASNIVAAKKASGLARRTVAITAVGSSKLAKVADQVISLPLHYVPRTPGILSFSLSLLAVLKVAGERNSVDFRLAMKKAMKDRMRLKLARGTTYLLGNSAGYSAALYSAAKAYELTGAKAHAELLEEFGHMEMFSLKSDDVVIAFSCFDPAKMARKLSKTLRETGYTAYAVPSRGSSDIESLFHSVFVGQLAVLDSAARKGSGIPSFLSDVRRLRASDSMIYHRN